MTKEELLMEDFKAVKLIFQKVGVRFFSIKGTTRASIRSAKFIDSDEGVQQAIFATVQEEELIKGLLVKEGFTLTSFDARTIAVRNTTVSIYRVLKDDKGFYINDIPPYYFKENVLNTLVPAMLDKEFCFTQAHPVDYLTEIYGQNWSVSKNN